MPKVEVERADLAPIKSQMVAAATNTAKTGLDAKAMEGPDVWAFSYSTARELAASRCFQLVG